MKWILAVLLATLVLMPLPVVDAVAADELPGWYLDAELAQVFTGGNAKNSTLGFGGRLRRLWTKSELVFTGGATQTKASTITRMATGTVDDFSVDEEVLTETTAQIFFIRGRYDYKFSPKFFAFGGADWMRNRFAGIDSRTLLALGAGNTWSSSEKIKFNTYYSFTYTFEEDVVENPLTNQKFPGVRLGYGLDWELSSVAVWESIFIFDWNLDRTSDTRVDWYNALPISISKKLLFKPGLQVWWRNDPALTTVPLFDTGGTDTGESVATPLGHWDTVLTLAMVVKLGPTPEE